MLQEKDFREITRLAWAQEVPSSNPGAPTKPLGNQRLTKAKFSPCRSLVQLANNREHSRQRRAKLHAAIKATTDGAKSCKASRVSRFATEHAASCADQHSAPDGPWRGSQYPGSNSPELKPPSCASATIGTPPALSLF